MKRNYHSNLAFLDLLFNTLLCFVALFVLSFVLITPEKQKNNIEAKAEFIITVTWDSEIDNDVDTYVEDPEGHLVAFMRREDGLMHLDRDDLGQTNDTVETKLGRIEYKENREIVTLRGVSSGEYVVNVHMYLVRDKAPQTSVTIRLEKLNPYSVEMIKNVTLIEQGDEKTAFRFTLSKEGEVLDINEIPKNLTKNFRVPLP